MLRGKEVIVSNLQSICKGTGSGSFVLIIALELGGLVLAVWIALERAVVQSVGLWSFTVQWVVPVTTLVVLTDQARGQSGRVLVSGDRGLLRLRSEGLSLQGGRVGGYGQVGHAAGTEAIWRVSALITSTARGNS